MALPDFLVIGAPKAGTTALHAALARHPQLFLTTPKEPKFFLCDEAPPAPQHGPGDSHSAQEWIWRRHDYERLFDAAPPGSLKGESTPLYLADHAAHRRIAALVPDARLVVVVRDPVDRAYSNWTHLWSDGLEPVGDFLEACALEDERVEQGWAPFWRYTWQGRYGTHLEHLYSVFEPSRVHVLRYKELVDSPSDALDAICRFLGVEAGILTEIPDANVTSFVEPGLVNDVLMGMVRVGADVGSHLPPQVWRTASRPLVALLKRRELPRPVLAPADRARLVGVFEDDITRLEELTGARFDDWRGERAAGDYRARRR